MAVKEKKNNIFSIVVLVICIVAVIVIGYIILKPKELHKNTNQNNTTEKEIQESQPTKPIEQPNWEDAANTKLPDEFIPKENRQVAPDFSLPDLKGNMISLSDFNGKFVLIDFTTTWCKWCETQKPSILELIDMNKDDFVVLAIDVRESVQDINAHYPNGPEYELLLDQQGEIAKMYGVQGYPFYLLISPSGEVIYYQSGFKANMTESVNAVLEEVRNN